MEKIELELGNNPSNQGRHIPASLLLYLLLVHLLFIHRYLAKLAFFMDNPQYLSTAIIVTLSKSN
jgi:hypothetical protein